MHNSIKNEETDKAIGADAEVLRIKKAAAEEMTSIEMLFAQLRDK